MSDNIFKFPKITTIRPEGSWPSVDHSYSEIEVARLKKGAGIVAVDAESAIGVIGAFLELTARAIATVSITKEDGGFRMDFNSTDPDDVTPTSTKISYSLGDLDTIFDNWPNGGSRNVMCMDDGTLSVISGIELPWIQVNWAARRQAFLDKYNL